MAVLESFLLFLTLFIPKAGTKVGSIPVYLSLLSLSYFTLHGVYRSLSKRNIPTLYLFALCMMFYVIVNFPNITRPHLDSSQLLAYSLAGTSFFAYYSAINFKSDARQLSTYILAAFYFLAAYGFSQKIFGDYTVAIPGITANFADASTADFLAAKNNMIWGINYLKLTSTYQNGNVFGVNFLLIAFLSLCILRERGDKYIYQTIIMVLVVLATASVSVYIGLIAGLTHFFILSNRGLISRKTLLSSIAAVLFLTITLSALLLTDNLFSQILTERVFDRNLAEGGGRTENIQDYFKEVLSHPIYLLSGTLFFNYQGPEVYEVTPLAVLQVFGFGFFVFLTYFILQITKKIHIRYQSCAIAYLIASISDGAFWLPPTALNFFLIIGIATTLGNQRKISATKPAV